MSYRRGISSTLKKSPKTLPSGSKDLSHAPTVPSSPERPEAANQDEPSGLIGAAPVSNISAPVYVTEEVFSSALVGLEEKLAALIASQCGKKRVDPLPPPGPSSRGSAMGTSYSQRTRKREERMIPFLSSQLQVNLFRPHNLRD